MFNLLKIVIYKIVIVFSDLVVSDVRAYKVRWFQRNCKLRVGTESSIPPLQNFVFFINIRSRFLCQNGHAKYAI